MASEEITNETAKKPVEAAAPAPACVGNDQSSMAV